MSDTPSSNPNFQPQESSRPAFEQEVALPKGGSISCARRLPGYDAGPVKAYAAQAHDRGFPQCFALVCERHLVPRTGAADVYAGLSSPAMLPLVHAGKLYWPPARQERYVVVYGDILGKKLLEDGQKAALGWRPDKAMDVFVRPVVSLLQEFMMAGFVHGGIRPSNFFTDDGSGRGAPVVLGDGLCLPQSCGQPVLYETIPRGMAAPAGRGPGAFSDDVYAFGATLAVLVRTRDPMEGLSEAEILNEKIENGSFAVLAGNERLRGSLIEILRGTLHDDPRQRWTLAEIVEWIEGRRHNPRQPTRRPKAPRPIVFSDRKYFLPQLLAVDVASDPQETDRILQNGDLEQWLTRAVQDDALIERVEKALDSAAEARKGLNAEARQASFLSAALDPEAPIRYKSLSAYGEGLGSLLAEAMILKRDISLFAEVFMERIAMNWLTMRDSLALDKNFLIGCFDSCRSFLRQNRSGYGIERCLYLLSADVHCLSEKLQNYYVCSSADLIRAFEDLCRKGAAPAQFLDRHSIAFLCARDPKIIEPFMRDIDMGESHRKILGNLKCLASIQTKYRMESFPAIAAVFSGMLPEIYARFHDRLIREKIEKSIRPHIEAGSLYKMAELLDNPEFSARDRQGFHQARQEYAALTREALDLEAQLAQPRSFGWRTGKEVAAMISGVLAVIVILCIGFMFFNNPKGF